MCLLNYLVQFYVKVVNIVLFCFHVIIRVIPRNFVSPCIVVCVVHLCMTPLSIFILEIFCSSSVKRLEKRHIRDRETKTGYSFPKH